METRESLLVAIKFSQNIHQSVIGAVNLQTFLKCLIWLEEGASILREWLRFYHKLISFNVFSLSLL